MTWSAIESRTKTVQWHQRNSVFPSKDAFLIVAHFLGPGINQFKNWNNQTDQHSPSTRYAAVVDDVMRYGPKGSA